MSILSIDWFRSKIEKITENVIENIIKEKVISETTNNLNIKKDIRPYSQLILTDEVLTIIFKDDTTIVKENVNKELFNKIKNSRDLSELLYLIEEKKQDFLLYNETLNIKSLLNSGLFEKKNDSLYFVGINRSIPKELTIEFINEIKNGVTNERFKALVNFWKKCCLNPNFNSANDLFVFLKNHKFKIDRHGNFYAYRRVNSRFKTDSEFVEFISNSYNKIKAIWRKSPSNYWVNKEDDKFTISKNKSELGNLNDLYMNLSQYKENSYTSAHTGLEDYKIGNIISMPRYKGDDNNQISCSKGFHAASKAYDYSSFGDTPILIIVNPMDVLAVPHSEVGKLRTCRWFFAMVLDLKEEHILDNEDFDVLDLGDKFEEDSLIDIENYVNNAYVEELKRHTFNMSNISSEEILNICTDLKLAKEEIKNRVNNF